MGAGNLPGGGNPGAMGPTLDFGFGLFTPGGIPVMASFLPGSVTSDTLGTTNTGVAIGPGLAGSQEFILYQGPGADFTCQFDAFPCGLPHQECYDFTFTTDVFLDSIRAYGVEGSGNPGGGCFPNSDMNLDFSSLPVVWGDFQAIPHNEAVNLHWNTHSEDNNQSFEVLRARPSQAFEKIGELPGRFSSNESQEYRFEDSNPLNGINLYKIRQVDMDGKYSETPVVEVSWTPKEGFQIERIRYAQQARQLWLDFRSPYEKKLSLSIYDAFGRCIHRSELAPAPGEQSININSASWRAGLYFLELREAKGTVQRKKVIIY